MDDATIKRLTAQWASTLRITPTFDVDVTIKRDPAWHKTGDLTIDTDDKKVMLYINGLNPRNHNLEEVIVHELFHMKLWPLDQFTESLIEVNYEEKSDAWQLAYSSFMSALEQTVSELAKTYLTAFGENTALGFGRTETMESFDTLYDKLKSLK